MSRLLLILGVSHAVENASLVGSVEVEVEGQTEGAHAVEGAGAKAQPQSSQMA